MNAEQINQKIAEMLGWQWNIRNGVFYADMDCGNAPDLWPEFNPAEDIADTWKVVRLLKKRGWMLSFRELSSKCEAQFIAWQGDSLSFPSAEAKVDTEAICLAALEVKRLEECR